MSTCSKVSRIHFLTTVNICSKFHDNHSTIDVEIYLPELTDRHIQAYKVGALLVFAPKNGYVQHEKMTSAQCPCKDCNLL